jgi:hypothetical protein
LLLFAQRLFWQLLQAPHSPSLQQLPSTQVLPHALRPLGQVPLQA